MSDRWMVCSACRKELPYSSVYYACSVSTCNRKATRLVFCSVSCWDSHVAILRHKDAWAIQEKAPASSSHTASTPSAPAPAAPVPKAFAPPVPAQHVTPAPRLPSAEAESTAEDGEVLVVVSKMKKYIRDRSEMNTADAVADGLSNHIRALCDAAIRAAAQDGRKTVLPRDLPPVRRQF